MNERRSIRHAVSRLRAGGRVAIFALAIVVGCSAGRGPAGPPGAKGETGPSGPVGSTGPAGPSQVSTAQGVIEGLVVSGLTGRPLAGANVTLGPIGTTASSAASGTFTFNKLAIGVYGVTLSRTGYVDVAVPAVAVGATGPTKLTISMFVDATSGDGMAVGVADQLTAGFDTDVTVSATVTAPDTDAAALSYAWKQTGGAPAELSGTGSKTLTFHTLSLSQAKAEASPAVALGPFDAGRYVPARFGPMAFGLEETGDYQFSLTVTDAEGHHVTAGVTVLATPPTSGLRSVPIGVPVWIEGDSLAADGGERTSWAFELIPGAGSQATLSQASTQFTSFTPDVPGAYTVTESVSGRTLTIYAATWDGVSGLVPSPGTGDDYVVQGCTSACHVGSPQLLQVTLPGTAPDMFKFWATTKHASALADGLDGRLGVDFGPACLACHTLGDLPGMTGGFGTAAAAQQWSVPATLEPGNYASLVASAPELAKLGNVQCENCHGPKNLDVMGLDDTAAKSFGAGVCAGCHSQASEWKGSLHANLQVAVSEGSTDGPAPANCARCHSAQGFAAYTQELQAGCAAAGSAACLLTSDGSPPVDGGANAADGATFARLGLGPGDVQPQTCAACHDPHDVAGLPAQLRVYDSTPTTLMNGLRVTGAGAGLTCMVCHNSRPAFAEVDDTTLVANGLTASSSMVLPHNGTQTDVLFGANAYFMPSVTPSPHLAVADTCAGCHHAIPSASGRDAGVTTNHSFAADLSICSTCHAAAFDGKTIQAETIGGLQQLDQAIFTATATLLGGAIVSQGAYNTTVRDAATLDYLCVTSGGATTAYLPLTTVPATFAPFALSAGPPVHVTPWRSLASVQVTFASNPFTGMTGLSECTSTSASTPLSGVAYGGGPVVLSISSAQAGVTHSAHGLPLVSAVSITGRAIYNEALLNNDLSLGVHNLPFAQALVGNTLARLTTVTASNP